MLALLLAGAAFVGGRLFNGQGLSGLPGLGGPSSGPVPGVGNGPGFQERRGSGSDVQPAKELPQTPADVDGIFESRQDQSIFVGTGGVTTIMQSGGDPQTSHSGPNVEVVITSQTKIYKDVTAKQFNGPPPEGQKIQQVVEPGSLEEIGQDSMITVWGRKTGDRFIADVLMYSPPAFIMK